MCVCECVYLTANLIKVGITLMAERACGGRANRKIMSPSILTPLLNLSLILSPWNSGCIRACSSFMTAALWEKWTVNEYSWSNGAKYFLQTVSIYCENWRCFRGRSQAVEMSVHEVKLTCLSFRFLMWAECHRWIRCIRLCIHRQYRLSPPLSNNQ